jgi:hypothetical protein
LEGQYGDYPDVEGSFIPHVERFLQGILAEISCDGGFTSPAGFVILTKYGFVYLPGV